MVPELSVIEGFFGRIRDVVFGARPSGYLDDLARWLDATDTVDRRVEDA